MILVTALCTLAVVVGWRELRTVLVGGEVAQEVCSVDPTASGPQGYCVQRWHRAAGLVADERTELRIVGRHDGQPSARFTVAPYPFPADAEFTARFAPDGITVTDADGVAVTYPAAFYRLD